jgi:hypothetical protein
MGRFDVLWSVGTTKIIKLLFVQVNFWIFRVKCLEIFESEMIWSIVMSLILQFVCFRN